MGDECNCAKCQASSFSDADASVWRVVRAEAQTEGRGRTQRELYLVVTDAGISLRNQSYEA